MALAQSFGVTARRLTEPDAVADAIAESLTAGEPRLIEVPISRELPERLNYG